jgi:hypothetical protein
VLEQFSAPIEKVALLDPAGDIEEPAESDSEAFSTCARNIWAHVSRRLDEAGIIAPPLATALHQGEP